MNSAQPLNRWHKMGLFTLLLATIAFGVVTEIRAAYSSNRKTDLGCYLRAGWAVREGLSPYDVTDDNNWHYAYPPVVAILLVPIADAPSGHPRDFMIPYSLTVAICYIASVLAAFLAVHWLALTLEETQVIRNVRGDRAWWSLRVIPILVCMIPMFTTFSRGQVSMFIVAMIAGMLRDAFRGRHFRAGLWLSAAICLKIYPAFLLLFPLWRRQGRELVGTACGLIVGVALIPTLVWGISGSIDVHQKFVNAIIKPGLGLGGEATRDKELMEITATDNQSIQAVLHNYQHLDPKTRPARVSTTTKLAHVGIVVFLTGLILWHYRRAHFDDPIRTLLFVGSLTIVMTIASPVSHTHYYCLEVPTILGLAAYSYWNRPDRLRLSHSMSVFLMLPSLMFLAAALPYWSARRESGLHLHSALLLLGCTLIVLNRPWSSISKSTVAHTVPAARAA